MVSTKCSGWLLKFLEFDRVANYIDVIIDRGALEDERTQLVNRRQDTDTALTRLTIE